MRKTNKELAEHTYKYILECQENIYSTNVTILDKSFTIRYGVYDESKGYGFYEITFRSDDEPYQIKLKAVNKIADER